MTKVIKESELSGGKVHANDDGRYYVYCPGCYEQAKIDFPEQEGYWIHAACHCFSTSVHGFNGDRESPTLTPSLLVTGRSPGYCCHSFVTNGDIQFLNDCSHVLKGQKVRLLDAPVPKPIGPD